MCVWGGGGGKGRIANHSATEPHGLIFKNGSWTFTLWVYISRSASHTPGSEQ